MLVYSTTPPGIELYYHANVFVSVKSRVTDHASGNTPYSLFVPPNFAEALFPVSLGAFNDPKKKQKQCLCKSWGGGGTNKDYYGIFRSGLPVPPGDPRTLCV